MVVEETVPSGLGTPGYVDSFAARRSSADDRSPEVLTRAAFEEAPPVARGVILVAWRALGFRLGPRRSAQHVFGWGILQSEPGLLEIGTAGPRATSRIVVRDRNGEVVITTFLVWTSPAIRLVWAVLSPVHRRMARYLIDRTNRG